MSVSKKRTPLAETTLSSSTGTPTPNVARPSVASCPMPKALPSGSPAATRAVTVPVAPLTTTISLVLVQTAKTSPSSSASTNRATQPISTGASSASVAGSITARRVSPPNAASET